MKNPRSRAPNTISGHRLPDIIIRLVHVFLINLKLHYPNLTLTQTPPLPKPNLYLNFWLGVSYYALSPISRLLSLSSRLIYHLKLAIYSKNCLTL